MANQSNIPSSDMEANMQFYSDRDYLATMYSHLPSYGRPRRTVLTPRPAENSSQDPSQAEDDYTSGTLDGAGDTKQEDSNQEAVLTGDDMTSAADAGGAANPSLMPEQLPEASVTEAAVAESGGQGESAVPLPIANEPSTNSSDCDAAAVAAQLAEAMRTELSGDWNGNTYGIDRDRDIFESAGSLVRLDDYDVIDSACVEDMSNISITTCDYEIHELDDSGLMVRWGLNTDEYRATIEVLPPQNLDAVDGGAQVLDEPVWQTVECATITEAEWQSYERVHAVH